MSKHKQTVKQVSSKSLIPPTEPDEATEADVGFSNEEEQLSARLKAVKAEIAALGKKKKQAVGGKKLAKMRKYAEETVDWAQKAASKFAVSTKRANDAVASLAEYEEKLGFVGPKCVSERHAEAMEPITEGAETLGKGLLELAKARAAKS